MNGVKRNRQRSGTYKKHRQRDGNPPVRALVHNIPRKRRRPQRDRQASPFSPGVFRMYQRIGPNGPFLYVSLREKVFLGEAAKDEG